MCGEHTGASAARPSTSGSSPRVRGTQRCRRWSLHDAAVHPRVCGEHAIEAPAKCGSWRFIPACAGNTHDAQAFSQAAVGSSPRVRGTLAVGRGGCRHARFIPACAGNTSSSWVSSRCAAGSSPRVRGTPQVAVTAIGLWNGSSPRVRGTRGRSSSPPAPPTVHPRVCGEHLDDVVGDAALHGSSPRVRGTHLAASAVRLHRRFIPACAGNTGPSSARRRPGAVHPRVCGEHAHLRG